MMMLTRFVQSTEGIAALRGVVNQQQVAGGVLNMATTGTAANAPRHDPAGTPAVDGRRVVVITPEPRQ